MQRKFKNRLLKLAELLESLPPKRFDYSCWVGDDWGGKANLSCGTTACALGWATTIPALRRGPQGMRLVRTKFGHEVQTADGREGVVASEITFGLNLAQHDYLFVPDSFRDSPGSDATAKQVAKHIRKFVKNDGVITEALGSIPRCGCPACNAMRGDLQCV